MSVACWQAAIAPLMSRETCSRYRATWIQAMPAPGPPRELMASHARWASSRLPSRPSNRARSADKRRCKTAPPSTPTSQARAASAASTSASASSCRASSCVGARQPEQITGMRVRPCLHRPNAIGKDAEQPRQRHDVLAVVLHDRAKQLGRGASADRRSSDPGSGVRAGRHRGPHRTGRLPRSPGALHQAGASTAAAPPAAGRDVRAARVDLGGGV